MVSVPEDLTGQRFTRLTARRYLGQSRWECACDCGARKEVLARHLKAEAIRSCGCLARDVNREKRTRHGAAARGGHTRLYNIWCAMKGRCQNPNHTAYRYYGARGIAICADWQEFSGFKAWAEAAGYDDSLSIDRINVDGPYSPDNCRWATNHEQSRNRRCVKLFEVNGETISATEAAARLGMCRQSLQARIKAGWSVEKALNTPPRPY